MNIDELTLGQIKQLSGLLNAGDAPAGVSEPHRDIGKRVVVRTYSAGVHYGTLVSYDRESKEVILENCRRLWRWSGAFTLSEIAESGPQKTSDCKFSNYQDHITLTMIEINPCSDQAVKVIESVGSYVAD